MSSLPKSVKFSLLFISLIQGAHRASASFIFNVQQVPSGVSVVGSGSLNTASLTFVRSGVSTGANIGPSLGLLAAGPVSNQLNIPYSQYAGISGPGQIGMAANDFAASSGTGDLVGVGLGSNISVPQGYTSNTTLSDSAFFSSNTLASLGLTLGNYVYTWGTGPTADSLTINIGVVPEPASAALIAAPVAIAMLRRRRRWLVR